MIRTLHMYLTRDLVRITLLALVAFTLVMTVLAVMEPLRKQGLSTEQVIRLFGFTLPMMVSLTLPVAALFATTIVYGRFSAENELLACSASGVGTMAVLKPALVLGLVVSACSLTLSNFVTPRMAAMASLAVKANVKDIFFNKLRSDGYVDHGRYVIHAQYADPATDTLHGVVVVYAKKVDDIQMAMASNANIYFEYDEQGDYYATIQLREAAAVRPSEREVLLHALFPLERIPLPPPFKEEASWYDWKKLLSLIDNPWENREVKAYLSRLMRFYSHDQFLREMKATIEGGGREARLRDAECEYRVRAGTARVLDPNTGSYAMLGTRRDVRPAQRVEVTVVRLRDQQVVRTVRADSGLVIPSWSATQFDAFSAGDPSKGKSTITLELRGGVTVEEPAASPQPGRAATAIHRMEVWSVGTPEIPVQMYHNALGRRDEILQNPQQGAKWLAGAVKGLKERVLPNLRANLLAELHLRAAYGVSCFLMIAMGAALGVMFRGGQLISAFALSVVPGSVVIVMLLMGKQLIRNTDVAAGLGLAAVWGGIVLMALMNLFLYARLARR